jgi:hypothetical protein
MPLLGRGFLEPWNDHVRRIWCFESRGVTFTAHSLIGVIEGCKQRSGTSDDPHCLTRLLYSEEQSGRSCACAEWELPTHDSPSSERPEKRNELRRRAENTYQRLSARSA